jgi:predicted metallopeptidase
MLPGDSDKNKTAGFDFTGNMTLLVKDIVKIHPYFSHIKPENILVVVSPSNGSSHGVVAKLRPLRFNEGSKTRVIRGSEYVVPEININGNNILYVLYFLLPRYLNYGKLENKVATVLHELHHISPLFNGDIRRFDGKNYAHGNSREKYDELINIYTREYLDSTANPELNIFLKYKYSEIRRRYGAVYGNMIRIPRSRPVNSIKRYLL